MLAYIVAQGAICEDVEDELKPLKELVKEAVGENVRRIGRFTQLALIGAARVAQELPKASALYLSSGSGDTGAMVKVLDAIYRDKEGPRPLSFINTVSNAACFHVVRSLGLVGPSVFVGSRYFALEMTLKSAALEMQRQRVDSALVGVVDAVVDPLSDHRQRLGVGATTALAEGSHWLHIMHDPGERPVLAELEFVRQFPDAGAVTDWLANKPLPKGAALALGQHMDAQECTQWLQHSGLPQFNYGGNVGYFESRLGLLFEPFFTSDIPSVLHLNRDPHGRYVALLLNKGSRASQR